MEHLDVFRHDEDSDDETTSDITNVSDMSWLEYDGRGGFIIRDDDDFDDDDDDRQFRASTPRPISTPLAPSPDDLDSSTDHTHSPHPDIQHVFNDEADTIEINLEQGTTTNGQQPTIPIPTINFEFYDDRDPFSQEWLPDFTNNSGITVDTSHFDALKYFELYFNNDVIDFLVAETNAYAHQVLHALPDTNFYKSKWNGVDSIEMKAFIGLQIAMGLSKKPSINDHWEDYWLTKSSFGSVFSKWQYRLIDTFLHFSNVDEHIPRGRHGYQPLQKIQGLLNLITPSLSENYNPGRELSIDESMARFKGRCHFRQYMKDKPTKRGFKAFMLCDSKTFYCLDFIIYTGKEYFDVPPGKQFTESIVDRLMARYLDVGHVLYTDNYYTSPAIFAKLQSRGTGAVGTVNQSRKQYPVHLKKRNLPLKKGDPPVFSKSEANNLVAVAWHDSKRVSLLSTIHTNNTMNKRIRCRGEPDGYRQIEKPVMADVYNTYMGGVDHFDQLMKSYQYPHRSYKWYKALWHYVREVCVVNAYILAKEDSYTSTQLAYRHELIDKLVSPQLKRREAMSIRSPSLSHRNRLEASKLGHFPQKSNQRRRCALCSKYNKRSTSRYSCAPCGVALCIDSCFYIHHTAKNTRTAWMRAH